jgi:PAS domain S-box-containing protein
MREAVITLDLKGFITSVSPDVCRLLSQDRDALIGMKIGDVFEEDGAEQAEAFFGTWLEALIMAGALTQIDACFVTKDESRMPVQLFRSSLLDDQGNVCGIQCQVKDMTECVRKED